MLIRQEGSTMSSVKRKFSNFWEDLAINWKRIIKRNSSFTVEDFCIAAEINLDELTEDVKAVLYKHVDFIARANSVVAKNSICFQLYHDTISLMCDICKSGRVILCVAKERVANCPTIVVDSPEKIYADMCNLYIRHSSAIVTAITGSIGKTTTKRMIECVYMTNGKTLCAADNVNLLNGAGYLAQHISSETKYFVQECSEDTRGYMTYFSRCLRPRIAIITTIDKSHLELFESEDAIKEECFSLSDYMDSSCVLITNKDDNDLLFYKGKPRLVTVSLTETDADYWADNIQRTGEGLKFCIHSRTGDQFNAELKYIYAVHNIYSALYAFAAGIESGIKPENIIKGIASYRTSGTRNNFFEDNGVIIYADCYNANGKSMTAAIETLDAFVAKGRKIAVLADVVEVGKVSKAMHDGIISDVYRSSIDILLGYGNEIIAAINRNPTHRDSLRIIECKTQDDINQFLRENIHRGDVVLFKGSNAMNLKKSIKSVFPRSYSRHIVKDKREILKWRIKIRFD